MAIDVGAACIDRPGSVSNYTLVAATNPANATGTIDSACVYSVTDMLGLEFASFVDEGSNVLSTNGDTNGSNLSALAGGPTTFNAPGDFTAFNINAGEYLGIYFTSGSIKNSLAGESGIWYLAGDQIPASSVTFNWIASYENSLYATGVESVGGTPLFWPEQLGLQPLTGIY